MRARSVLGGALWIFTILLFVAEAVTASAWPVPYAVLDRTISDLGRIHCAEFCSPGHSIFTVAIVCSGILTAVGAILLARSWGRLRLGAAAMISMVIGGIFVGLVGVFPVDANLPVHSVIAVLQWLFQLAAMILVLFAVRGMPRQRVIRVVTSIAALVSLVGFITFTTLAGPHGLLERLAFDTLTWWQVSVGLIFVTTRRPRTALPD